MRLAVSFLFPYCYRLCVSSLGLVEFLLIMYFRFLHKEQVFCIFAFFTNLTILQMDKIVFATNNLNKLAEVRALIPSWNIVGLADIGCFEDIPETASSLEGNAKLKANFVTEKYGLACFADDTGLEIKSLNGEPGVYSARYAGTNANSEANLQKVLNNLKNKTDKSAQFRTVIALNLKNKTHLFEGICKGVILSKKKGINGFGYDPIFLPKGHAKSFAEMSQKEKGIISHRGKAVEKLMEFLS